MTMGRLGRSRALVPELGERHGVYPLAGFKVRTLSGRGLDGLERLIFCCLAFTSCPRFCCNSKFSFKSCVQDCRMSTACVGETSALAMACDNLLLLLSRSGPAVVGLQGAGGSSFSWATNLSLELLACVMDKLQAGALSCATASVEAGTAVSDFKGVEAGTAAPKIVSTRSRSFRIMSSASSRRPCITAALSVMLLSTEDSRSRRVLCNSAEKDSSQASLSDRSRSSCASMRLARSSKVHLDLLDSSSCESIRSARSRKAGASSASWSWSCCCCWCSRDVTPRSCSSRDRIRCSTALDSASAPVEDLASELPATLGALPLPKGAASTGAVTGGAWPGAGGACCADPGQEDSDGGDMPARTDGGNAAAGHGTVTTLVRGLRPSRDVRAEGAPILACGTRSRTDSLASLLGKDVILWLRSVLGPCGPAPTHTAAPPKIAYLGMPPSLVLRRSMRSRDARGGPSPRAHEA
mmetsp:Transcript_26279/g.83339  ORF Transcript_26279/g.83339 Transcript_26279/m.83339 type:complete len:467 (+) Transcript_26279:359-1759(+)